MFKLALRLFIFAAALYIYLFRKDLVALIMGKEFFNHFTILHVFWVFFMVTMILHLFPNKLRSMALRKAQQVDYVPVKNYSEYELLKFIQKQNLAAWRVMLVWLVLNGFWALLYLAGVIHEEELLLLTCFYFLSDYICILFFCPFQSKIMKNKCCVNCRIYDWGHFMMFTPMLFIKDFFSWSLFFTSLIVLIRWEILYSMHPERFWEGSNQTLKCINCKDRTCQIKEALAGHKNKTVQQ